MTPEPPQPASTRSSLPQHYVVLIKYVPARNVGMTTEGRLERSAAGSVINPLDQRVLMFAYRLREAIQGRAGDRYSSSKIVCLAMAPPNVTELFRDCLAYADETILLTDRKFAGADTIATSYTLNCAIDKVVKEHFGGDQQVIVLAGEESQDGSTGHIPPQVAQGRGVEIVPYVTSFRVSEDNTLAFETLTSGRRLVYSDLQYPLVVSLSRYCGEEVLPTLAHAVAAQHRQVLTWTADDLRLDEARIGRAGSKTVFVHMYKSEELRGSRCRYLNTDFRGDLSAFLRAIDDAHREKVPAALVSEAPYCLDGNKPSNRGPVCVFAEQNHNAVHDGSLELVGEARKHLALPLNVELVAVLAGHQLRPELARTVMACGADTVYQIDHPLLADYLTAPYTSAIGQMVVAAGPQILLLAATHLGRVLAPSLAGALQTGITADCTGLRLVDYDHGRTHLRAVLRQTRPAGGGVIANIVTAPGALPQMMTVRPHTFPGPSPDHSRPGKIVPYAPDLSETDRQIGTIHTERLAQEANPLMDARIVVSGGRGLKDKHTYDRILDPLVAALADSFPGTTISRAVSREMADRIPSYKHLQVGQSGITLSATELYFALGISGAPQHIAGMRTARTTVAVNSDPEASIFGFADFGIVEDVCTAVPQIVAELTKQRHRRPNGHSD